MLDIITVKNNLISVDRMYDCANRIHMTVDLEEVWSVVNKLLYVIL